MKESLTQEEQDLIPGFVEEYKQLALNTNEPDKEATKAYIEFVCSLDKEYPKNITIKYIDSPLGIQYYINIFILAQSEKISTENFLKKYTLKQLEKKLKKNIQYINLSYYSDLSNYGWISFYDYFTKIGVCNIEIYNTYSNLFKKANIYQFAKLPPVKNEGLVLVCRKHTTIHRDNQERLHSYTDPAITFADGYKLYFIKGIEVPEHWVTKSKSLSIKEIDNIDNAELRRIALELYGEKNYLIESGATKISQDEYGELWKKEIPDDEPIICVSVFNSTPEPEYSIGLEQRQEFRETELALRGEWYKKYLFRVPPTCRTPLEALAWYAKTTPEDYKNNLILET